MTPNDVKIVADNIDDFIEVPDGVERLRKAVLVLAASGKLVPQDPKEGSAEKFYSQIQSDREKIGNGATGRSRKIHDFPSLTPEEIPYQIPSSWKWVRLGEIIEFRVGKTPPRNDPQYWSDAKVPWVSIADLNAGGTVVATKESINELALEKVFGGYIAPKGTLLFSFKLTIGKMSVLGVDACHNEAIAAFFTLNDTLRDYLFKILPAINTTGRTSNAIKGKTLNSETLALIEIPLPPLSEQKRIVKKVEEVMGQLDELEIKKQERDETRTRLARSAMQSLGKGESKIAFGHLTELVKTPADLKELEGALLTLAVSGKLVQQDKEESVDSEPSNTKEIGGRKKKVRVFSEITREEIPFEIPTNWKWVRLGSVFTDYSSGSTPSRGNDGYYRGGHTNWYKSGELNDGILFADAQEKITDSALEECHLRLNKRGDLLIAMYGATAGRVAILDNKGTTNQAVWGGTPKDSVDLKYLFYYVLQSRHLLLKMSSGAAQPNISGEKISVHPLALPPLAEQKRIVKKVEEVMILINRLKKVIIE